MLQELSIRNFAIIDDLKIKFSAGLTILSGETGAGKSILVNAVNLLLGSRASSALIRTGCDAAELEALFELPPESEAAAALADNGYPIEEGLLIRRIISRSENNRIYIGGRLATMQLLGAITENLASISGQHAHQNLLKEEQHLLILDQFGGLLPLRQAHADGYHQLLPQMERLNRIKALKSRQAQQSEFLQFQKREIEEAALADEEDAELEREHIRLKNSGVLYQAVYQAVEDFYGRQGSVSEQLSVVGHNLDKAARIDAGLIPRIEQLAEIGFRLEDLVADLRSYLKSVHTDDSRLDRVEERLNLINKLKRKYGGSLPGIREHLRAISFQLAELENLDDQIADAEKKLSTSHDRLAGLSNSLSKQRKVAAEVLAKKVEAELANLNMPQTRFEVAIRRVRADEQTATYLQLNDSQIFETGVDRVTFKIAPNVGEDLKPLSAIASGGELSRIVLALKAILAATGTVETVIFDEVDTGIGGGTAEVVGQKLSELACHHQVLCITHLPQIAKFGDHHFGISKQIIKGRTLTNIKPLDDTGRIEEIARMLGGMNITAATLNHARELLNR